MASYSPVGNCGAAAELPAKRPDLEGVCLASHGVGRRDPVGTHSIVPLPGVGWVLYDGSCGVCARWVIDRTGLAPQALLEDLRLLHADGRLTSGADVYRFVMRRLWWAYPLYLLSVLPGGRQVFDWGYRTFARHRLRVSAACGLEPPAAQDG